MHGDEEPWALVLAAGQGSRLRSLTTTDTGRAIPKQFCSLRGGSSLLHEALGRAQALTSIPNMCAVVAVQHQRWWLPQLGSLLAKNIFVQPQNRGTANGILLPLLFLLERDPGARIVLLPSDHHVREEAILARSTRQALKQLQRCSEETLLLGCEPEEADPQLGYIVPGNTEGQGKRLFDGIGNRPRKHGPSRRLCGCPEAPQSNMACVPEKWAGPGSYARGPSGLPSSAVISRSSRFTSTGLVSMRSASAFAFSRCLSAMSPVSMMVGGFTGSLAASSATITSPVKPWGS
jgi:hypothetical protein